MLVRCAQKNTVPVIILAGFLGSGKTTILNQLLLNATGVRIAVIVNDFGSINIDSMLIAAKSDTKLELTNGCICCAMDGGELEETLDTALLSKPDVVIIEASGLAEPEDMARMVLLSANEKVAYGGIIYVVDAVNYLTTLKKHPRVKGHAESAELIVITKVELVGNDAIDAVRAELSSVTGAPIVMVKNGELAPGLIFDVPERINIQPSLLQQKSEQHAHFHNDYTSITFEETEPLDFQKLKKFLNQPPKGLYRLKGYVYFGAPGFEQKFVLQSVGRRWDMYVEEWNETQKTGTTLVLIGTALDEASIHEQLKKTIGEGGATLDIERYLRD